MLSWSLCKLFFDFMNLLWYGKPHLPCQTGRTDQLVLLRLTKALPDRMCCCCCCCCCCCKTHLVIQPTATEIEQFVSNRDQKKQQWALEMYPPAQGRGAAQKYFQLKKSFNPRGTLTQQREQIFHAHFRNEKGFLVTPTFFKFGGGKVFFGGIFNHFIEG